MPSAAIGCSRTYSAAPSTQLSFISISSSPFWAARSATDEAAEAARSMVWCAPWLRRSRFLSTVRVVLSMIDASSGLVAMLGKQLLCRLPALGGKLGRLRLVVVLGRRLGLVDGEAVVERLQADAEHVGRLALGAALRQRRLDQAPADFVERAADAHREQRRHFGRRHRRRRQVGADLGIGQDEGALHVVLQLAHVARPAVGVQRGDGGLGEALAAVLLLV